MATSKSRYCKPCWSEYCRARHARLAADPEHKAKQAAKMRAWRAANPGYKKKTIRVSRTRYAPVIPLTETKECTGCGRVLPRAAFYYSVNGSRSRCHECHSAAYKARYHTTLKHDPAFMATNRARGNAYRQANPEKAKASKRRSASGWEGEAFEAAWIAQGGLCAICTVPMKRGGGPGEHCAHADHDHVTKRTRGILCHACNLGLGMFKDSIALLGKAVAYLQEHAAQ